MLKYRLCFGNGEAAFNNECKYTRDMAFSIMHGEESWRRTTSFTPAAVPAVVKSRAMEVRSTEARSMK